MLQFPRIEFFDMHEEDDRDLFIDLTVYERGDLNVSFDFESEEKVLQPLTSSLTRRQRSECSCWALLTWNRKVHFNVPWLIVLVNFRGTLTNSVISLRHPPAFRPSAIAVVVYERCSLFETTYFSIGLKSDEACFFLWKAQHLVFFLQLTPRPHLIQLSFCISRTNRCPRCLRFSDKIL